MTKSTGTKKRPGLALMTNSPEYQRSEARNYLVVKSNDLIQKAKFNTTQSLGKSLSLLEQKVLLYLISRVKPDDDNLYEQIFDIGEFCKLCGISDKDNYTLLKQTISKLKSRTMWIETEETSTTLSWISKATIYKRSGKIKIRLDEDLRPYLLRLSRNFTRYSLHNIVRMKSKYGIMLYELLKSYSFQGRAIEFPVEWLKESLDCLNYENFTNFKNKVLLPALNDINTYSELSVSVEYKKTGRQFTDIIFYIRNLETSESLEDRAEADRRYQQTENEILQMTLDEFLNPGSQNEKAE